MNLEPNKKNTTSCKRSNRYFVWVASIHILILLMIFLSSSFKGCKNTPQGKAINVNISNISKEKNQKKSKDKQISKEDSEKKETSKSKPKKKWTALDPNQIKKSTSQKSIERKETNPSKTPSPKPNFEKFQKNLKDLNKDNFEFSGYAGDSQYYNKVSKYLHRKWDQPSQTSLSYTPIVKVKFSIDSKGNILNSKIIKKCNDSSMNSSVKNLLNNLNSLPSPPNSKDRDLTVSLKLKNNF